MLASNYQGAALPPLGLHPPLPHSLHHTVHGYRHHQCQHNIFLKKIVKFNVKVKLNLNLKKILNKNTLFPLFTLHTQHQHNLFTKEDIPIKTRTRIVLLMLIAIVTAGTRSHSQKIPRWSLAYLWKKNLLRTPCFLGSSFLMIPWFLGCPWKPFRGHPVSLFSQNS